MIQKRGISRTEIQTQWLKRTSRVERHRQGKLKISILEPSFHLGPRKRTLYNTLRVAVPPTRMLLLLLLLLLLH